MPRPLEIVLGRRDLFAVKVAFLPDPNAGCAATREHSASWGSLEIWVHGHNLCAHIEQGEPIDSVHWEQGYQLAEELLDEIGNGYVEGSSTDIDRLYQDLGLTVQDIVLSDRSIRAVAIAGRDYQPNVLLNTSYLYGDEEPRRFTMAHELCHILHDRSYGAHLAMASGPWAPVDVEKRANAFAAMLLMPDQVMETIVRGLTMALASTAAIWEIANRLRTSFSSTLEHLCNRGFIDETIRDQLRTASATCGNQFIVQNSPS